MKHVGEVNGPEREALRSLIKSPTATRRQALRARIVLMAATGATNTEIADLTQTSLPTVALWRKRYAEHGIDGLADRPRSGRPSALTSANPPVDRPLTERFRLAGQPIEPGMPAQGDESLEPLLAAAVRAISRRGYAATRVADIAKEAGVAPATVHYHFKLRQDILVSALLWVHERGHRELERATAIIDDPLARVAVMIERTVPYPGALRDEYLLEIDLWSQVRDHPELLEIWERYNNRWTSHVAAMIEDGIAAGVFTCSVDAAEIAERLVAMTDGLSAQAAIGAARMPHERVRGIVLRFAAEQLGVDIEQLERAARLETLRSSTGC